MQALTYIRFAFRTLKTQRMRTFLTTLGIIIGVMTVITMMSIIQRMNRYVYKVLGTLGSNTIYVQKYKWKIMMGGPGSRKEWRKIARRDLIGEDAKAIERLPSISLATLVQSISGREMIYRDKEVEVQEIEGGTPKYMKIANYNVVEGRSFVEMALSFRRQVATVGKSVVENLFKKGEDPLGKDIGIGPHRFSIIGVLEEKGTFLGQNLNNKVVIPLTTLRKFIKKRRGMWGVFYTPSIVAQVKEGHRIEEAMDEMEELLRQRRGCKFNEENNFGLNTQQMILEAYNKITAGIFIAMIGIASLALIVGG